MIRTKIIICCAIVAITCFKLKAQEKTCFNKVNSFLYNEKYYLALGMIDSLELVYPDNVEILYKKANIQRKIHRNKEAYTSINKALALDLNNPQLLKEYGKICISNKKLSQAIEAFDTVFFHLDTLDYSTGLLLGKCYQNQKNWNNAFEVYYRMQEKDPSNTYYLYKSALCLANNKRGLEAIPYLERLTRIDSNHTAAYGLLHKIYVAKNDREKALEQLNHLKRIEPNNYEHYNTTAYFHLVKNHIFIANENFEKAIALGDPEPLTHWDNARCLYQMKFYEEAIAEFTFLEQHNTRFIDFCMLGNCYKLTERPKAALKYYDMALILAIPSAFELSAIFDGKANVFINQKDYNKALESYQLALGHYQGISSGHPAAVMTIRHKADLYQNQLNQPEKAMAMYQELLTKVSEYSNPGEVAFYKQEINRLNEEVFFKGD